MCEALGMHSWVRQILTLEELTEYVGGRKLKCYGICASLGYGRGARLWRKQLHLLETKMWRLDLHFEGWQGIHQTKREEPSGWNKRQRESQRRANVTACCENVGRMAEGHGGLPKKPGFYGRGDVCAARMRARWQMAWSKGDWQQKTSRSQLWRPT